MGVNQNVPVPAHGRVSDVGRGWGASYQVKKGVVAAAEAARAVGGGAMKKTPISESLPVKPSDPPVEVGGKS